MPKISVDHPAGEALRRLMRKTMRGLAQDLEQARSGKTVHPARRRLKLARSLLRLMKPALGKESFQRENQTLRDAAHALAVLRHTEAMGEAIAKLRAATADAEAEESVFAALAAAARELRADVVSPEETGRHIETALALIEELRPRIAEWTLPKRDMSLFVKGLRICYAKARSLLRDGLERKEMPLLHEARKSVIHHLHHVDLLKPLWPKLFKVWTAELQELREDLGDLHDLDELTAEFARPESPFAALAQKDQALALIDRRRQAILARIASETGHLFAEQPKNFADRIDALWRHSAS
ncbi:CHAD domain-containing protein [Aestuariivirga sp. YIM B02566]|uniref:CHAD domain-containing protein n=1 Tax=Taklimakanibacter albus TaxID=2800327 RepID=A0ACC5R636_9HYPH|nr:CHAD domain-containing protein [Aestuariivirga sp. YIM B02566]